MSDRAAAARPHLVNPFGTERESAETDVFSKIRIRRGFEYIYDQIRSAIAEGKFRPGDRLPAERDMAEIFGVSRQGVREAIRGLESTGLVETRPGVNGGVFVRNGDPQVVSRAISDLASLGALSSKSLLEARILLTTDVIRLACQRATQDDFQRLEDDIAFTERQSATEAGIERTAQITEFYRILASATHNEVLVLLMDSLSQVVHLRLNRAVPKPNKNLGKVRRKILGQLRAGDAEAATAEITAHLTRLEKSILVAEAAQVRARGGT